MITTKQKTQCINFSMQEYCRRVADLSEDGYRVQYDSRQPALWCALLVHHNGNRIRLKCLPNQDQMTQTTNNVKVYSYGTT